MFEPYETQIALINLVQMKTVLIISSFVSASHVGAGNSAFCLQRLGLETAILPTTIFGRHPGWGPPGGTLTPPDLLSQIWEGIRAQGLMFDAVMTGYMGHPEHIALSCEIITYLKRQNPALIVLVDPVMGDRTSKPGQLGATGQLYVKEPVARALIEDLLPLANITTPNLWELEYITQETPTGLNAIYDITKRKLPCESLVTSVPITGKTGNSEIGVMWNTSSESYYVSHEKFLSVPNGGGDALAGTFFAHRLNGVAGQTALNAATSSIFEIMTAADLDDLGELPLIRKQDALLYPPALTLWTAPYDC